MFIINGSRISLTETDARRLGFISVRYIGKTNEVISLISTGIILRSFGIAGRGTVFWGYESTAHYKLLCFITFYMCVWCSP
jgi:hypothetical protein